MLNNVERWANFTYYKILYLGKIIIWVYKFGFINNLYIFIINYKPTYKSMKESYLNKYKNDELYFTNC